MGCIYAVLRPSSVQSSLEDAEKPHYLHFAENWMMTLVAPLELPLATRHFLLSTKNRKPIMKKQAKKNGMIRT